MVEEWGQLHIGQHHHVPAPTEEQPVLWVLTDFRAGPAET